MMEHAAGWMMAIGVWMIAFYSGYRFYAKVKKKKVRGSETA
jgi:hypothetical protein